MTWTLFWQVFILITWTSLLVTVTYRGIADNAVRAKLLLDEHRQQ